MTLLEAPSNILALSLHNRLLVQSSLQTLFCVMIIVFTSAKTSLPTIPTN
jgi:hypothetical protein